MRITAGVHIAWIFCCDLRFGTLIETLCHVDFLDFLLLFSSSALGAVKRHHPFRFLIRTQRTTIFQPCRPKSNLFRSDH